MSQQYYQYNNRAEDPRLVAQQVFAEEKALQKRREINTAWWEPQQPEDDYHGPRLGFIRAGEYAQNRPNLDDDSNIAYDMNVRHQVKAHKQKIASEGGVIEKSEREELALAPWTDRWKPLAAAYRDDLRRYSAQKIAAGGIIMSDDNAAINVINILAEMMGRDERTYVLEQAVRKISTPNLTLSLDTWSGFNAYQNVGEAVEVDQQKGYITRQTFALQKSVGSFGITDEANMVSDRNLFQIHAEHVVRAMARIKAVSIVTALQSTAVGSTAASATFDAFAAADSLRSTINPLKVMSAEIKTIGTNQGTPDTIISDRATYMAYLSNSFINGTQGGVPAGLANAGGTGPQVIPNPPGFTGFTWIIDDLMSAGRVTIYDRDAAALLQGPVRTAQYRKEGSGVDHYITRDWFSAALLDATQLRAVTAVA